MCLLWGKKIIYVQEPIVPQLLAHSETEEETGNNTAQVESGCGSEVGHM